MTDLRGERRRSFPLNELEEQRHCLLCPWWRLGHRWRGLEMKSATVVMTGDGIASILLLCDNIPVLAHSAFAAGRPPASASYSEAHFRPPASSWGISGSRPFVPECQCANSSDQNGHRNGNIWREDILMYFGRPPGRSVVLCSTL